MKTALLRGVIAASIVAVVSVQSASGSQTQTAFSELASDALENKQPAIMVIMMPEPKKSIWRKTGDFFMHVPGVTPTVHGIKKVGHWINVGNVKAHPARDFLDSILSVGAAYYFAKQNFGK